LLQTLRERFFDYQHAIPSYVGPSMNESRYWRGPVWINCNWLVADGLRQLGVPGLADRIRDDALELIEEHGFREYFSPTSGAGHGSDRFSWTAALYLEWSANT
jgi:glycogen debranching enzyme